MTPQSGVYKITNTINNKAYIGSAVNLTGRSRAHFSSLKGGYHHSSKLQRSYNKYGKSVFSFDVLLYCDAHNLLVYEQAVIDAFDSVKNGFNIVPIAGRTVGHKHTEEAKRRMSEIAKGKPKPQMSLEARKKISLSKIGKKRKPFTEEARKNMSLSHIGKSRGPHSEETKRKIAEKAAGRTGKKHSPETLEKIRAAHVGKKRSEQAKENMRIGRRLAKIKREMEKQSERV